MYVGRRLGQPDLRLLHRPRAEPPRRQLRPEAVLRAAAGADRLGGAEPRHGREAVPAQRLRQREHGPGESHAGAVCVGCPVPGAGSHRKRQCGQYVIF